MWWAAAPARSGERLAMARRSAWAARRKAGSRRSLIRATPRMPQRSVALVGMGLSRLGRAGRDRSRKTPGTTVQYRRWGNQWQGEGPGMCLLALGFRVVEDAPVVVGANR